MLATCVLFPFSTSDSDPLGVKVKDPYDPSFIPPSGSDDTDESLMELERYVLILCFFVGNVQNSTQC